MVLMDTFPRNFMTRQNRILSADGSYHELRSSKTGGLVYLELRRVLGRGYWLEYFEA